MRRGHGGVQAGRQSFHTARNDLLMDEGAANGRSSLAGRRLGGGEASHAGMQPYGAIEHRQATYAARGRALRAPSASPPWRPLIGAADVDQ